MHIGANILITAGDIECAAKEDPAPRTTFGALLAYTLSKSMLRDFSSSHTRQTICGAASYDMLMASSGYTHDSYSRKDIVLSKWALPSTPDRRVVESLRSFCCSKSHVFERRCGISISCLARPVHRALQTVLRSSWSFTARFPHAFCVRHAPPKHHPACGSQPPNICTSGNPALHLHQSLRCGEMPSDRQAPRCSLSSCFSKARMPWTGARRSCYCYCACCLGTAKLPTFLTAHTKQLNAHSTAATHLSHASSTIINGLLAVPLPLYGF
ncbi:hypothetical protein C8Q78DRAFT_741424 [Trametes maxima]|nr:hypothetical protein C8Q78DRAFT_741424 [Trametes maxima]